MENNDRHHLFKRRNRFGRGGARQGAGRPASMRTKLKRLAIAAAEGEAEKSLQFVVQVRDNGSASFTARLEAAKIVMDRVWGKPRQTNEIKGGVVEVDIVDLVQRAEQARGLT